jgi:exopolysaccharide production protein ExoY
MKSVMQFEDSMVSYDVSGPHAELSLLDIHGIFPPIQANPMAYRVAKRGLDICLALIGLLLLGCMLPIIVSIMLLEGWGPIFYKQKRVGKDLRPFNLYKIRTMRVDADEYLAQHPELLEAWSQTGKLQNDPRVTKFGKFLRQTSIDELPQMFNILRGDLSFVGPRPIQFSEIAIFGELIDLRQTVKPGLTGLWQVSGRSTTDYQQRAILDCIYAIEHSFWIDILIIVNTIPVVLHGLGAF